MALTNLAQMNDEVRYEVQDMFVLFFLNVERFSYDLETKTRKQNINNKRTERERFDWFIERIQTRVAFDWLSERSGQKTSCPRTNAGRRRVHGLIFSFIG